MNLIQMSLVALFVPLIAMGNAKVIGNGGNVEKSRLVTRYEIISILHRARRDSIYIANFLEKKKEVHFPVSTSYENFRNAIRGHKILIDLDPCYDQNGKETDASTVSAAKDQMCINIVRLEKKLRVSNARPEILGLVAHEYSHFVGANENEAREFQKRIVSLVASTREAPDRIVVPMELDRAKEILERAFRLPVLDDSSLYLTLTSLHDSLSQIFASELVSEGYNILSKQQRSHVQELRMKVSNWSQSLCEQILSSPESDQCKFYLDNIYQGKDDVSLLRFAQFSEPHDLELVNSSVVLSRRDSAEMIKANLKLVLQDINQLNEWFSSDGTSL